MAVRADDLALLNLIEDALPSAVGEGLADVERLVLDVVELEYDGVGLTAVHARMGLEECE